MAQYAAKCDAHSTDATFDAKCADATLFGALLAAVESIVAALWPQPNHVVVSLPDARKGEQLVLVMDEADADKTGLLTGVRAQGYAEHWIPKAAFVVPQIPVLGLGKIDFQAASELASKSQPLL